MRFNVFRSATHGRGHKLTLFINGEKTHEIIRIWNINCCVSKYYTFVRLLIGLVALKRDGTYNGLRICFKFIVDRNDKLQL